MYRAASLVPLLRGQPHAPACEVVFGLIEGRLAGGIALDGIAKGAEDGSVDHAVGDVGFVQGVRGADGGKTLVAIIDGDARYTLDTCNRLKLGLRCQEAQKLYRVVESGAALVDREPIPNPALPLLTENPYQTRRKM